MRDDRERLLDMLEAIQKIEQYAHDETFSSQNENLVEVWMIHHLQIIGEAAARVSNGLREQHPEVAWGGVDRFDESQTIHPIANGCTVSDGHTIAAIFPSSLIRAGSMEMRPAVISRRARISSTNFSKTRFFDFPSINRSQNSLKTLKSNPARRSQSNGKCSAYFQSSRIRNACGACRSANRSINWKTLTNARMTGEYLGFPSLEYRSANSSSFHFSNN